ncbi:polysaccharide pyruvyl transferase family protein [Vibrio alfacsensis]|uniref:polysaccharide pyruvyl transferase family protein n=1 Tax=Vibrio alfacsensis TaxID=1074311 RepID=UPI001C7EA880|nr:polysaccharide pyruvyl transferase family protein [Vibrio alfacsensis]
MASTYTENFHGYRKLIKILHIASFEGNIGDNASHLGLASIMDEINASYAIDRLEIRKAYRNYILDDKLEFNEKFADLANTYDLVIFGGGGFLDYWVEGSSTGTTIDIEPDILDKISTRILITSVGCNPHRSVPKENYVKFTKFLDYVRSSNNITIALRNDGSVNSIINDFGLNYLDGVVEILDHGYFYSPSSDGVLPIDKDYVAINITDDQLNMQGGLSDNREWYYKEFELLVSGLAERGLKSVFVPHIHQDVEAIGKVLSKLPSGLSRTHTVVAPCLQGDKGTDFIFNIYKNANFTIASRYHANVCSMAFNTPLIGLSPLNRIEYTHAQLLSKNSNVSITPNFHMEVLDLIDKSACFRNDDEITRMRNKTIDFYKSYFSNI